jgi:hypothetical protein
MLRVVKQGTRDMLLVVKQRRPDMFRVVKQGSRDMLLVVKQRRPDMHPFSKARKPRHAPKQKCFYVADNPLQINRRADAKIYASRPH